MWKTLHRNTPENQKQNRESKTPNRLPMWSKIEEYKKEKGNMQPNTQLQLETKRKLQH